MYQNIQPGPSIWDIRFITAIAFGFLAVSMLCNVVFYSAFGHGGHSLLYAIIGLFFDFGKVGLIGFIAYLMRDIDRNYSVIVVYTTFWIALTIASLFASIGFLSQINEAYEAARLKDSRIYAQRQEAARNARAEQDQLIRYAKVDTSAIAAQIASLRDANQTLFNTPAKNSVNQRTGRTVGQMTANCTKTNWYFNHYCGKVTDNNASIQKLQARLDGHQRYQAALAHYEAAEQKFSALTVSAATNQAHPLFINLGLLINSNPASVKAIYILFISLLVELLASVLMFARYKLIKERALANYQIHPITPSTLNLPSATRLPLKKAANHPSTTHWLSDELLQRVKNDIAAGKLTRLSFRHLQRTYQISHATAKSIRQALLRQGIAQMDEATHQLMLTGKH